MEAWWRRLIIRGTLYLRVVERKDTADHWQRLLMDQTVTTLKPRESKDRGTIGTNTGRHGYRGTGKNTQEQVQDWYGTTRDFRKHLNDRVSGKMAAIKSPQNLDMKISGQGRPKIKILLYPHNFIMLVFGQWILSQEEISNASKAKRGFNRSWQNTI